MEIRRLDRRTAARRWMSCFSTSVDGRPHLEQVSPVLAGGEAGLHRQAVGRLARRCHRISDLAEEDRTPCFPVLRCGSRGHQRREDAIPKVGKVLGCDASAPARSRNTIPISTGTACTASRGSTRSWAPAANGHPGTHHGHRTRSSGKWNDGRIGSFRGSRREARLRRHGLRHERPKVPAASTTATNRSSSRSSSSSAPARHRHRRRDLRALRLHGSRRREQAAGRPSRYRCERHGEGRGCGGIGRF